MAPAPNAVSTSNAGQPDGSSTGLVGPGPCPCRTAPGPPRGIGDRRRSVGQPGAWRGRRQRPVLASPRRDDQPRPGCDRVAAVADRLALLEGDDDRRRRHSRSTRAGRGTGARMTPSRPLPRGARPGPDRARRSSVFEPRRAAERRRWRKKGDEDHGGGEQRTAWRPSPREHPPYLAGDLDVLARRDDERPHGGAGRADLRVGVPAAASLARRRARRRGTRGPPPPAPAPARIARPTPPVNTSASRPPSEAAIAAIDARSRWT